MGFLGGMLVGSVLSRVVHDRDLGNGVGGPGAMGGIGLVAGGTIGYLDSPHDLEFRSFDQPDLSVLNALSRFPRVAPQ